MNGVINAFPSQPRWRTLSGLGAAQLAACCPIFLARSHCGSPQLQTISSGRNPCSSCSNRRGDRSASGSKVVLGGIRRLIGVVRVVVHCSRLAALYWMFWLPVGSRVFTPISFPSQVQEPPEPWLFSGPLGKPVRCPHRPGCGVFRMFFWAMQVAAAGCFALLVALLVIMLVGLLHLGCSTPTRPFPFHG